MYIDNKQNNIAYLFPHSDIKNKGYYDKRIKGNTNPKLKWHENI